MRFVVADEWELLIWVVSDPSTRLASEGDVAIWTDAVDFVGTQSALFDALWREAKELTALAPAESAVPGRREPGPRP